MSNGIPTDEQLLTTGRTFAGDILQQAVSTATSPEQLNGQLHVINCMAIHVLATNIFNRAKSTGESQTTLIMEQKELIEEELQALNDHAHEMELVKPDIKKPE